MSIIVKSTNSYAFRTNSAKNPWKTLEIKELYYLFGCLIKLGLYKHPSRHYCWENNGILAQVPLSKYRFEDILRNFHFKDRGLNPEKDRKRQLQMLELPANLLEIFHNEFSLYLPL
jgi:Transposase IS4